MWVCIYVYIYILFINWRQAERYILVYIDMMASEYSKPSHDSEYIKLYSDMSFVTLCIILKEVAIGRWSVVVIKGWVWSGTILR